MKTKLLGILMVLTVAVTSLPAGTTVNAAETDIVQVQEEESVEALGATEAEIKAGAVQLTSGVTKIGTASSDTDNWFKITVPNREGYETISCHSLTDSGNLFLDICEETSDGKYKSVYGYMTVSNAWYPDRDQRFDAKLTLPPGDYYLNVTCLSALELLNPDVSVQDSFTICYTFTDDSTCEKEPNDTMAQAKLMSPNISYHGSVDSMANGNPYDEHDYYKFVMPYNGYIKLNINTSLILPDKGKAEVPTDENGNPKRRDFRVRVLDSSKQIIYTNETHGDMNIYCKKGTYYIDVSPTNKILYYDCYDIKFTPVKVTSGVEYESNDTYKTANKVSFGTEYSATFSFREDVDWYKFVISNNGTISIRINNNILSSSNKLAYGNSVDEWRASVYKNPQKEAVWTVTSNKKLESKTLDLKKGTYYLKIERVNKIREEHAIDSNYSFKLNYTKAPKAVKITSTAGGKKKAIIKWTKSTDASGYYIYRATSKRGTYKKIATITKKTTVKYTDKKALKSKKTYYYKVVAYKKTNGLIATSSASGIKGVKIK